MSWKETCVMELRMKFIVDVLGKEGSMAQLCRDFNVSRKTGYKWLNRYLLDGIDGLKDLSRAPINHPNVVSKKIEEQILDFRRTHPCWGPRKIRVRLMLLHPEVLWPCASTIGEILKRHGLTIPRRRRNHAPASGLPMASCNNANKVWCADFKGWFRTADGRRCDPFTMTDAHTRFILRIQAMDSNEDSTGFGVVKSLFEAAFREFGLPEIIRTDNGSPFATVGLAGLSRLSVWWIRLGIVPERIRPGKPQDNGRHERMHRTLKAHTASPPAKNLRSQQRSFNRFRQEFNFERPHEALDMQTPGSLYEASPREFSRRLPKLSYPFFWHTRRVRKSGRIKWKGREISITAALKGETIGLEPIDDGIWKIYFKEYSLGIFNERTLKVKPIKKEKK